jgi:hypothetical protein
VDCSFGNVFDGIIHFTIQLHSDITLPHFINIEDEGGHLAEYLFIFSDQHRRCCFCFHVGQFCRAAIKASGISEVLWSKRELSAGALLPLMWSSLSPSCHSLLLLPLPPCHQ